MLAKILHPRTSLQLIGKGYIKRVASIKVISITFLFDRNAKPTLRFFLPYLFRLQTSNDVAIIFEIVPRDNDTRCNLHAGSNAPSIRNKGIPNAHRGMFSDL